MIPGEKGKEAGEQDDLEEGKHNLIEAITNLKPS